MPRGDFDRARYQARKLAGLCVWCGAGLQEDDGVLCVECREIHEAWRTTESGRASIARSIAKWRAGNAAIGRCLDCSAIALPGRKRCQRHLDSARARQAVYRERRTVTG